MSDAVGDVIHLAGAALVVTQVTPIVSYDAKGRVMAYVAVNVKPVDDRNSDDKSQ